MRTFLLMVGSAVCGIVLFVAAVYGYFYYQWSRVASGEPPLSVPPFNEKTISFAPPIIETERFLGSHAMFGGDFHPSSRQSVLAAGPGKLVGSVTSAGKPLQGLRLRLALNGAVMSQWATSGADGKYEIAVPYATYRIDGYELDSSVVHKVLAGKIEGPREFHHGQETAVVAEGKPGKGRDFQFVDPVRKKGPFGEVSAAQPLVVSWEAYPNAASYRVQLVERKSPEDYASHHTVFGWRQLPTITGTSINLTEHGAKLKNGHHYNVEIEALDEGKKKLADSPRATFKMDFRVTP